MPLRTPTHLQLVTHFMGKEDAQKYFNGPLDATLYPDYASRVQVRAKLLGLLAA